ncbi:MAG TPA: prolyl oligopeptidase family serine peptidase [Chloroflexota bacterium]|nr:prolyl oligopeptidase family serine peptidase [Chloroflexota bacterium]
MAADPGRVNGRRPPGRLPPRNSSCTAFGAAIVHPFASALQSAGTTVVVPQYTPDAPATAVADIERAVAFAAGLPERGALILGGHSAGAQLAALAVLRDDVSIDGLLLVSSIYNLPAAVADGGLSGQLIRQAFGSDPATWEAQSPRAYARGDTPPIWVVHGARDDDVRPERAFAFVQRLQEAGAPVAWTPLPETSHVDTPLALLRRADALLAFLRDGRLPAGP